MRHSLLSLAALLLLAACPKTIQRQLNGVEQVVNTQPDSAMALIRQISIKQLKGPSTKARYALLASMTYDKNYYDVTDDSLINIAADYYATHGSLSDRIKALYYQGIVRSNAKQYTSAIVSFEQAEQLAVRIRDLHYLGLTYLNKSRIFTSTNNIPAAIENSAKSLAAFNENNEPLYAHYAQYALAVGYLNNKDHKNARAQLHSLLGEEIPPSLSRECRTRLADSYVFKEDSLDAALAIYASLDPSQLSTQISGNYATALALTGDLESATALILRADSLSKSPLESTYLSFLEATLDSLKGNYKSAYSKVRRAAYAQDSLTRKLLAESLTSAQRDYFRQEMVIKDNMVNRQRAAMWYGGIIALLCLLVGISYVFYWKTAQEAAIKEQMAQLSLSQQTLQKNNAGLLGALFFEKVTHLSVLSGAYYTTDDERVQKQYLSQFKNSLKDLQQSEEVFEGLEKDLDMYCSGIMTKIREQLPNMSKSHRHTLMLFFAGIPDEYVKLIMNRTSTSSIKTFRTRLRQEIKEAHAPDEEFFLNMLKDRY